MSATHEVDRDGLSGAASDGDRRSCSPLAGWRGPARHCSRHGAGARDGPRSASFALTSNRGVDEWLGLFDNPILGNSALDRLANAAHQLVIEGPSYRAKLAPKHRGVDDQP